MKSFLVFLFFFASAVGLCGGVLTWMPGTPFRGTLPALTEEEEQLPERLREHVSELGNSIGARGVHAPDKLADAEIYISNRLKRSGLVVTTHEYESHGTAARNVVAELAGNRGRDEIVVVGAHYDSPSRSPGSEDNASGCAVLLEIAEELGKSSYDRTIRFVLFSNGAGALAGEEGSGAFAYATRAKESKEKVVLMLALDSLGIYRELPSTQSFPFPLNLRYPDRGNFLAFVGDVGSRAQVARCVETFRTGTRFPSEGAALPSWLLGIGSSDAAAFRAAGFRAVLVTDTGILRYPNTGRASDTPDRLDYPQMARVTAGLSRLVATFAQKKVNLSH